MNRIQSLVATALMSLVIGACGGNNFSSDAVPELTIELTEAQILLDAVGPSDSTQTIAAPIILRNSSDGDLRVTNIEWVARPDRLEGYFIGDISEANEGTSCSEDAECGTAGVCLRSGICRDAGFEATPFDVGNRYDLNFLLRRGDTITCPTPGADVPVEIQDRYCGELRIETNASNNSGIVEEGAANIYFITSGGSGEMAVQPGLIQFTNATAGVSQSSQFTIENRAGSPLFIERGDFGENAQVFEITPSVFGREIPANSTETFTLTYAPSVETELEFSTTLEFSSSSVTSTSSAITIEVTQGVGDAPLIEVDPLQLSFADATSQTLTVRNYGGATLALSQMRIVPSEAAAFYRIMLDGVNLLEDYTTQRVARMTEDEPSELELTVEFDSSAEGSSVGTLEIRHNDSASGNITNVSLLGDATEVAVGELYPTIFSLRSDGPAVEREVAIYNNGNDDLVISGVDAQGQGSTTNLDLFRFEGFAATVPPGGVHTAKVFFDGDDPFNHGVVAAIESNHAGQEQAMTLLINARVVSASPMDLSVEPSFSNEAVVGQSTTLTLRDAGDAALLDSARWFILERPEGSALLTRGIGESLTFEPDAAGTYRFGVLANDSTNREEQVIFEFEAVN
ncbi:choice-of-anchor D domain-containing protein [Lujinxingia vulgaris]|uniref:Choice-of-anchor D domain-containing protein n=1 Tax=Lujinxingia vulgaris TaxID=2600176 RepID=A0A5C6X3Q6_9DELT|nr:choice-of-anchor D domain-containing protein [Lujinxingia vulgaris]TXD32624.1 choice-of-anchor D domain-containing protein [Lujinxingia vulgaris]